MKANDYYNHLGYQSKFYTRAGGRIIADTNLDNVIQSLDGHRVIDFPAVSECFIKGYIFGDRTLIKGISKTPWMARLNREQSEWNYFNIPKHDEILTSEDEISENLYRLLRKELLSYVREHSNIGILLTGGMDSRIVACVLNDLAANGAISNIQVTAITWGLPNSRDVVYASRIAKLFKWEWVHLTVDAEQLMENVGICVELGCEVSPIHFHAMSKVAKLEGISCIVAGSFGDSIGRGEYSRVHVKNLTRIDEPMRNVGTILRDDFLDLTEEERQTEIDRYHALFPRSSQYQQFELDHQLHYMRRMLNPCFAIIDNHVPVYQAFTDPEVFGYVWSINPKLRNDNVYRKILEKNNKELLNIPWARTGLVYPKSDGRADGYLKNHHNYGELIRNELMSELEKNIMNGPLIEMNLFNFDSIRRTFKNCRTYPIKGSLYYESRLIWLASLSTFVNCHGAKSELESKHNSIKAKVKNQLEYQLRYLKSRR